jgi:heme exporter protein A
VSALPLLRLEGVACIRGGRLLFEGVDLALAAGDAVIIRGPNGAGKSSLMRIAAGLLRASTGTVEQNCRVALADEGAALDERLTVRKALDFWAAMDGTQTEAGLEPLGLGPLAEVPVRMLSTGQRKRAVLARVVASGAPLWLLDEPLNGLDAEGAKRLTSTMAAHRRAGGAIVATTHQAIDFPDAAEVRLG